MKIVAVIFGLCALVPALPPSARAEAPKALSDEEIFRLEDRYRAGNYLAMGGLLAEAVAALTHDRDLALGFYGASVALRFGGLPVAAASAQALCRAGGTGPCPRAGYAYFALSAASEAALAAELFALDYDRRHGAPRNLSHLAGAYAAAGVSTAAFLLSWYRFRDSRLKGPGEERVSFGIAPRRGGGGLAVRFALGGKG